MSFVSEAEHIILHYIQTPLFWISASCLLGLGILWNLSQIFYTNEKFVVPLEKKIETVNMDTILDTPYFGASAASMHSIQHSRLSWKVVGVLYATDPAKAQVVLEGESGFDHLYHVGETIQPGVTILAIEPKGVILSNQGRKERLSLPENALRFEKIPNPLQMKETP